MQARIDRLTAHLDQLYTDRLSGLLPEADFQRMFSRVKEERERLEETRQKWELCQQSAASQEERANELVQRFMETACESRELLVSLMKRVELTEHKNIIIEFRFREPEAHS